MTAAVGASATASESQPWSGKMGTLTAKAKRKASEASQRAAELPEMACCRRGLEVREVEGAGAGRRARACRRAGWRRG